MATRRATAGRLEGTVRAVSMGSSGRHKRNQGDFCFCSVMCNPSSFSVARAPKLEVLGVMMAGYMRLAPSPNRSSLELTV